MIQKDGNFGIDMVIKEQISTQNNTWTLKKRKIDLGSTSNLMCKMSSFAKQLSDYC